MKKEEAVKRCRKCGKPIAVIMSRPYRNYVVDAEAVVVAANAGGEIFIRQDGTKLQARELTAREEFAYIVNGFTKREPAYRPHRCAK